jgi:hypothetical protein
MKNELRNAYINDQLPRSTTSEQNREEKITQMPHAKSLKDIISGERKKEASKPIYLVRYE